MNHLAKLWEIYQNLRDLPAGLIAGGIILLSFLLLDQARTYGLRETAGRSS